MDKVLFHMFSDDRFMDSYHSTSMDMNSVFHCIPTALLYETISCSIMLFQVKEHSWLMMKIPSLRNTSFRAEWDS